MVREANTVITRPAFAMSLIEKYPVLKGITLVGVVVTRMKAKLVVRPAARVIAVTWVPVAFPNPMMRGIRMVAVTVLEEKTTFRRHTPKVTRNNWRNIPTLPISPKRVIANHSAAPVRYRKVPKESPETIRRIPAQSISFSISFHLMPLELGRKNKQRVTRIGREMGMGILRIVSNRGLRIQIVTVSRNTRMVIFSSRSMAAKRITGL
jgi:hypothetical protein